MDLPHLISITGAGPGDPDLLTVKAQNRLKEADLILYDALMGDEILQLAKPGAVKKYVGKWNNDGQNQKCRQDEIHHEFLKCAGENKRLVRLKTGDPMIFGRGAEEIRFCKKHHLNYEVIPGITAGIAAASLFSIPLTERGKNNQVLFWTGRKGEYGFPEINSIKNVLGSGSPVIVYMGLNSLTELARELAENGISQTVPVQILSRIAQYNQKCFSTTMGELEAFLAKNKPETPSIIILGQNAERI